MFFASFFFVLNEQRSVRLMNLNFLSYVMIYRAHEFECSCTVTADMRIKENEAQDCLSEEFAKIFFLKYL